MCAARTGSLLNLSSLANDCGVSHTTVKAWLSVLETSYIVFLLQPYHENFNKRLVKSPKLYFYDTGLAALLMGIQNAKQLITHPARGALFETWVVSELIKRRFNQGLLANIYFWRDSQGNEVDVLIDEGDQMTPVEVKSGQTISSQYFSSLDYWNVLNPKNKIGYVVYGGDVTQKRTKAIVMSWKDIDKIL